MAPTSQAIEVFHLGLTPYADALEFQQSLHQDVVAGRKFGALVTLQHAPVLTLGKNSELSHVLLDRASLDKQGIAVVLTDRGGEVTAHEPGQFVAYPILPLQILKLPPKRFVELLMKSVILTVQHYGIAGQVDPDYPGVWVGSEKICAVGVRIKERVSLHGIALNVGNDLNLFKMIVPCGIQSRGVTSMQNLLGYTPDLVELTQVWLREFTEL